MSVVQAETVTAPTNIQGVAGDILLQYLERIENLEEEKAGIMDGIRDTFQDAKGNGFDVKAMRELLKIRKMKRHELDEQETTLYLYRQAIGMA